MTVNNALDAGFLQRLNDGDEAAAAAVYERFARRLIGLARARLDSRLRQKLDPDDVVQSVFRSFFTRQREQKFELTDWDNLWSLLALITVRKCTNVRAKFGRKARNAGLEVRAKADLDSSSSGWVPPAREPTPADAAVLTELVERLLNSLPDKDRRIVGLCLEGKSLGEISNEINRAERTVRRVIDNFRAKLEKAVLEPGTVF
jgi:RNA polymerase sigma-70 factor (ECF subfamily)